MEPWMFLLLVPVARFLIYANGWYYLNKARRMHSIYIAGISEQSSDDEKQMSKKAAHWLTANISEIKNRVEQAGVPDPVCTFMEFAGYGHVVPQSMSALDNLLFHNKEVLAQARQTMAIAAGYYKTQSLKSIYPIYWVEVIFFLPKQLVSASGLHATSKIAEVALKLVQIVYWILVVMALVFRPEWFIAILRGT